MAFPWLATGEGPPNKGQRASDKTRALISEQKRELVAGGWVPANKGKKMNYTVEHKMKLRENIAKAVEANRKYEIGDKFLDKRAGYIWIYVPDHPSSNNVGYIHEHRLIGEKALGRPFKRNECVHHVNGDKTDNRPQNLLICTGTYHMWLHQHMAHLFQRAWFMED